MNSDSTIEDTENIQVFEENPTEESGQRRKGKIFVDGRGYENHHQETKEIYNLIDVIEEAQIDDKIYEEILKRAEGIVEKIALKVVPDIAERIIREEIEKIKNE